MRDIAILAAGIYVGMAGTSLALYVAWRLIVRPVLARIGIWSGD